jgi:hypothetical protein
LTQARGRIGLEHSIFALECGPAESSSDANRREELNRPELREEASAAIRSLIEEVRLVPVEGRLEIELAGILALTSNNPRRNGRGLQVTLVAGVGFTATSLRCLALTLRSAWRLSVRTAGSFTDPTYQSIRAPGLGALMLWLRG